MKRMRVIVFLTVVLLLVAAAPAAAYHWHYYHPVWGLGYWPHYPYYAGPFYPPLAYPPGVAVAPPFIIQQQPQTYVQRPAEQAQPPQQILWYWCNKPQGFWPHIQQCEGNSWMQVLPQTAPPSAPR